MFKDTIQISGKITFVPVAVSVPLLLLDLNGIVQSLLKPVSDPSNRPNMHPSQFITLMSSANSITMPLH